MSAILHHTVKQLPLAFLCAAFCCGCVSHPAPVLPQDCKMPAAQALRLKESAAVHVCRTADDGIAYLVNGYIVCLSAQEVREVLVCTEPVAVHVTYLSTGKMISQAVQPLKEVGIPISYITAVNSFDAVPFVYTFP